MSPIKISGDPNIVILREIQQHPEDARSSNQPIALRTAIKAENENKTLDEATGTELSLCCEKTGIQQENIFLEQFLRVIWRELAWSGPTRSVETVWPSIRPLEAVAKGFAPVCSLTSLSYHTTVLIRLPATARDDSGWSIQLSAGRQRQVGCFPALSGSIIRAENSNRFISGRCIFDSHCLADLRGWSTSTIRRLSLNEK